MEKVNSNEEADWQISEISDPSSEHLSLLTGYSGKCSIGGQSLDPAKILQQMANGERRDGLSYICKMLKANLSTVIMEIF